MKTISLISLALCAVCICADDNVAEIDSTPFVLGGESAKQGQFPYQLYLRKYKGTYFCDGAIISEWFVLTSAQCIRNQNLSPSNIIIVMGTVTQFGSSVKAAEISVHPKYVEKHHYNDIALLLTAEKIEFSPKIQPIKLPTFDWMGHGAPVTISAWGLDVGGNGALQLKYSHTKVLGLPICGLKHGRFIFNTNLCTKSKKVCTGDEGGPLVHEGRKGKTLVGIVSSYNCGSDKPDIYTRVFSYRKWIKAEMYRLLSKPTSHPDVPNSSEPNYPASSLKSN